MALIRYEPWNSVARLHDDIHRTLGDWAASETSLAATDWIPLTDADERVDRIELFVDLPGVAPDELEIALEDGVLTLTSECRLEPRSEPTSRHLRARRHGRLSRRFLLPDSVDAERVEARSCDSVLEVVVPKKAAARPRRIETAIW